MCGLIVAIFSLLFIMLNVSEASGLLYRLFTAAHRRCLPFYFLLDQKVSKTQDPCLHADPHVSL